MNKNSMADESPLIARLRTISGSSNGNGTQKKQAAPPPPDGESQDSEEVEHCDFCSKPIPPDHRHFADLENMKFMCACEMCTILQAEKGEYRPLPQRYKFLGHSEMTEDTWNKLRIPVNMAFIVYNANNDKATAFYPSPAGATESELSLEVWDDMQEKNPVLKDMEDDLEGFLINRVDEPYEYYIVPIDSCYKLIGLIRLTWKGLHGGEKMKHAVKDFFSELKQKAN